MKINKEETTHKLTVDQRLYLTKILDWAEWYESEKFKGNPKERRGLDLYLNVPNKTIKKSTLRRILKKGFYHERENKYLNDLKLVYKYLKKLVSDE